MKESEEKRELHFRMYGLGFREIVHNSYIFSVCYSDYMSNMLAYLSNGFNFSTTLVQFALFVLNIKLI